MKENKELYAFYYTSKPQKPTHSSIFPPSAAINISFYPLKLYTAAFYLCGKLPKLQTITIKNSKVLCHSDRPKFST